MAARTRKSPVVTKAQYESLAGLRRALRAFLNFSRDAAVAAGIPPQQHQALLAIKGYPGRERVTVGELAEFLQLKHHSAVGLVDRLGRQGWVRRVKDHRHVHVSLTRSGEALVQRLSAAHLEELRERVPELLRLLAGMSKR